MGRTRPRPRRTRPRAPSSESSGSSPMSSLELPSRERHVLRLHDTGPTSPRRDARRIDIDHVVEGHRRLQPAVATSGSLANFDHRPSRPQDPRAPPPSMTCVPQRFEAPRAFDIRVFGASRTRRRGVDLAQHIRIEPPSASSALRVRCAWDSATDAPPSRAGGAAHFLRSFADERRRRSPATSADGRPLVQRAFRKPVVGAGGEELKRQRSPRRPSGGSASTLRSALGCHLGVRLCGDMERRRVAVGLVDVVHICASSDERVHRQAATTCF